MNYPVRTVICILLLQAYVSFGQSKIDSLNTEIRAIESERKHPSLADTNLLILYSASYWELQYDYPDSAMYFLNKSVALCEELLSQKAYSDQTNFDLEVARLMDWANMAYCYGQKRMPVKQREFCRKQLARCEELEVNIEDQSMIADLEDIRSYAYQAIGFSYEIEGKADKAIYYFRQALKIREKLDEPRAEAVLMNNIGASYFSIGKFELALKYYFDALDALEAALDKTPDVYKRDVERSIDVSYGNIAKVYASIGDRHKALFYRKKAIAISRKNNDLSQLADNYNSIGDFYTSTNRDSALYFFEKSLHIYANRISRPTGKAAVLIKIGNILGEAGDFEKAKDYFVHANAIYDNYPNLIERGEALTRMAWISRQLEDWDDFEKFARHAYEFGKQVNSPEYMIEAADYMKLVSLRDGDYKQAYEFAEIVRSLSDSLRNDELIRSAYQLEAKYNYEKQAEFDKIRHQERLKDIEEEKSQQRSIIRKSIIALLILITLLIVLYRLFINNKKVNRKLVELGSFKQAMNNMIVHDLKTPLHEIIGLSDQKQVRESAAQMDRLVMNILDVQRFEKAQIELQIGTYYLSGIVESGIEACLFLSGNKGMEITNNVSTSMVVECDEALMIRVIINLLTNAIKFSENGSSIEVFARNADNNLIEVSVQDHGVGIRKDLLENVFESFVSDKSGLNNGHHIPSTGIGLTFCKQVINAHGTRIDVKSSEGIGTTVVFTLRIGKRSEVKKALMPKMRTLEVFELTSEEKEYLQPMVSKLAEFEVYYFSDIIKSLDGIDGTKGQGIAVWKSEMEDAVENINARKYKVLLEKVS